MLKAKLLCRKLHRSLLRRDLSRDLISIRITYKVTTRHDLPEAMPHFSVLLGLAALITTSYNGYLAFLM